MESRQDFGADDVSDASLPKAQDLAEFGFVEAAESPKLGADHAAREIIASIVREGVENLSKLNAEALLREGMKLFVDGGSATSGHEELWSVRDGFLLSLLATADLTKFVC